MTTLNIFFDGSCEPQNPGGIVGYGWVAKIGSKVIEQGYGVAYKGGESATNNVGEYMGLIAAMIWAVAEVNDLEWIGWPRIDKIVFRGDSQLVVNQMNGKYRVRNRNLKPMGATSTLLHRALKRRVPEIEYQWVPRKQNKQADKLANKYIDDGLLDRSPLTERLELDG